MNYKLAKELKDKGFPQKENKRAVWRTENMVQVSTHVAMPLYLTMVYLPTLEELREACGKITMMYMEADTYREAGWYVANCKLEFGKPFIPEKADCIIVHDKELIIALAKLWIKLQKK